MKGKKKDIEKWLPPFFTAVISTITFLSLSVVTSYYSSFLQSILSITIKTINHVHFFILLCKKSVRCFQTPLNMENVFSVIKEINFLISVKFLSFINPSSIVNNVEFFHLYAHNNLPLEVSYIEKNLHGFPPRLCINPKKKIFDFN